MASSPYGLALRAPICVCDHRSPDLMESTAKHDSSLASNLHAKTSFGKVDAEFDVGRTLVRYIVRSGRDDPLGNINSTEPCHFEKAGA